MENVRFDHDPHWHDRSPRTQKFYQGVVLYGSIIGAAWIVFTTESATAKLIGGCGLILGGIGHLQHAWDTWQQSKVAKKPPQP